MIVACAAVDFFTLPAVSFLPLCRVHCAQVYGPSAVLLGHQQREEGEGGDDEGQSRIQPGRQKVAHGLGVLRGGIESRP